MRNGIDGFYFGDAGAGAAAFAAPAAYFAAL